jgi:hypothetical protein
MSMTARLARWGGARLSRRLSRSLPVIGGFIAVATIGAAMRRKGVVRGALDTALNAVPVLGGAKLLVESVRGRDLIANRPPHRIAGDDRRAL